VTKKYEVGQKIDKPWGYEKILSMSSGRGGYAYKMLYIKGGHRLSKQYHEKKEETIFVKNGIFHLEISGTIKEPKDTKVMRLVPGMHYHIKPGTIHRFTAKETAVELLEVSTKQLDDVVRLEDDFGRK
jgi:mannose-6-phosphate isomerase-like protein (cupin superfamily)